MIGVPEEEYSTHISTHSINVPDLSITSPRNEEDKKEILEECKTYKEN